MKEQTLTPSEQRTWDLRIPCTCASPYCVRYHGPAEYPAVGLMTDAEFVTIIKRVRVLGGNEVEAPIYRGNVRIY